MKNRSSGKRRQFLEGAVRDDETDEKAIARSSPECRRVKPRLQELLDSVSVDPSLPPEACGKYTGAMRAKTVRMGNSQGVRIPKPLLVRSGLSVEVEIVAQNDESVIRSARLPREGWDNAFLRMAASGHDRMLDDDILELSSFDDQEGSR